MTKYSDDISKAKQLASILSGKAGSSFRGATVQRSHRFPLYYFALIENMAKIADCSVSSMINQIIEVGVDAMYKELSPEMVQKIHSLTEAQIKLADKILSETSGKLD